MKLNLQVSERDYVNAYFLAIGHHRKVVKVLFNIVKIGKIVLTLFIIYSLAESLYELMRGHGGFIEVLVFTILGIYLTWISFLKWPQTFRRWYRESNYRVTSECEVNYHRASSVASEPNKFGPSFAAIGLRCSFIYCRIISSVVPWPELITK
jgi:hypothetical protein